MQTFTGRERDASREAGRRVLAVEASAILSVAERIGAAFEEAVAVIDGCRGRVISTGLGKSGHIAAKIAATLCSLGIPSSFIHAADALHGDAGAVTDADVLLGFSNSGATPEVVAFAALAAGRGAIVVAVTGGLTSPLAESAEVVLDVGVDCEADQLDLAPTASTTAALALGDALAVAVATARGLTSSDFAANHPAGALGARLEEGKVTAR